MVTAGYDTPPSITATDRSPTAPLTRLTTNGLSRYRGHQGPADAREKATLRQLLRHEDDKRRLALQAVRWIGEYNRASAANLVLSVSFQHSPAVVAEVLSAEGEHGYLSYEDVSAASSSPG